MRVSIAQSRAERERRRFAGFCPAEFFPAAAHKMMMGEVCLENDDSEVIVNTDVLYEVLRRVDGVTLAKAACASSTFYTVSSNEAMWEHVCNQRWPSTRDPEVKSIVSSLGGFRKFYGACFPLIVNNKQPFVFDVSDTIMKDTEDWFDDEEDMIEELSDTSLGDFMSIVDVVFRGKPIVSRVLHGIPGAGDVHGWFSNCPFRIDLVSHSEEEEDYEPVNGIVISDDMPMVVSIERERKDGRFWKALWDDMKLSWIIINKKTKHMANLASWRPLGGQRHWPNEEDFLLRFGSVLPAHELLSDKVVQCSVILKCRLLSDFSGSAECERASSFMITELSMQLEDMAGTHLNGRHSLLVLKEVLSSRKSMNHHKVLKWYGQYMRAQSELKTEKLRSEGQGQVEVLYIICGILSFVSLCYFMF